MDGLIVAWRGMVAGAKFFFWTVVGEATSAIYWHKEASREQLVLKPRRPKDLYDNGYALFAFDLSIDGWVGYWRAPDAKPGMLAAETYAWLTPWEGIPFHEVEFSDMPHVTFKVRAVEIGWCRKHLTGEAIKQALAAAQAAREQARAIAEGRLAANAAEDQTVPEAPTPKVVH